MTDFSEDRIEVVIEDSPGDEPEEGNDYQPLFEGESIDEGDLRGESSEEGTGKDTLPAPEQETPPEKPPSSHQENDEIRAEREAFKAEINELKREIQELKGLGEDEETTEDTEEEPAFKVLSDEEFEELLEDDPVSAMKYERKLRKYEEGQKEKQTEQQRTEKQEQAAIQSSIDYMTNSVPGLFDEKSSVADTLAEFAEANGLDGKYLAVLTDPTTKFILQDPDNPKKTFTVPLAHGAAALTKFIYSTYQSSKGGGGKKGKVNLENKEGLSEAEFAKLSPEDQEKYLGAA